MMSKAAERAQAFHENIRNVLLKEWDPIGVQGILEAQDEYGGYIPVLYAMLIACKPIHEVFEYLLWIEVEHMGLSANRQRTWTVAEKLVHLSN